MKTKTTQWRLCLATIVINVFSVVGVVAQSYTLTSDDVEVVDGVIISCSYDFAINEIIIPDILDGLEVTSIAGGDDYDHGVFYDKGIVELTLPSALVSIGNFAFYKNSLTILDLSGCSLLTSIGDYAFFRNSLVSLNLSNCTALTFIGEGAFSFNSLTSFTLPTPAYIGFEEWLDGNDNSYGANAEVSDFNTNYIAKIPTYTLTDDDVEVINGMIISCTYNFVSKFITIPYVLDGQEVTGIASGDDYDGGVFYAKGIREITLPNSLTSIGNYGFYNNSLTSLDLSDCTALTAIGNHTFSENSLTNLDISGCTALLFIGNYAFYSNSLTSLDLNGCKALTSIGNDAFHYNSLASLDLSACISLSAIGNKAFGNNSLTSIDLSGCTALSSIGSAAFTSNLLASLDLNACTALTSIGSSAFAGNLLVTLDLGGCSALTIICRHAFFNNSLTSLDLGECTALTSIGRYAFDKNSLTSFTLPTPAYDSFEEWIDGNDNSYTANSVVADLSTAYTAKLPTYTLTSDDVVVIDGLIISCSYNFVSRFINIPNTLDEQQVTGVASVDDYFSGVFHAKGIRELTLPSTLVTIGDNVFSFNSLTSLDLSGCSALSSIGRAAFWNNFLISLDFSGCTSLTSIGRTGFNDNSLLSLDLSECTALVSIGAYAFNENSLTSFTLPTPAYDSFVEWKDGNNNNYAANTEVSDLETSYTALLVSGILNVDKLKVILYPNPANSLVTVSSEQGNLIDVYSTSGSKVMSQMATSNAEVLNIESLQSGTYIVKVGHTMGELIVE